MSETVEDFEEHHQSDLQFDPLNTALTLTEQQFDSLDAQQLIDRREALDLEFRNRTNAEPRYLRSREKTRNRSEFVRCGERLSLHLQAPRRMPHRGGVGKDTGPIEERGVPRGTTGS